MAQVATRTDLGAVADPRVVVTPLKADRLEATLRRHGLFSRFEYVCIGITFGFDFGLAPDLARSVAHRNHRSSTLAPAFIDEYIASECQKGRYTGPYSQSDLERLVGAFISSPLGLVLKAGTTDKFRLVQDLSFPRNDEWCPSVNDLVDSDDWPTEWSGFKEMVDAVLELPPGSVAATFDVEAAYRCVPVAPHQQRYFVVQWNDKFYLDRALCFGFGPSAGVFGAVGDVISALARCNDMDVLRWVDDYVLFRTPGQRFTEDDFTDLSAAWGVPWKAGKTKKFASVVRFIGFEWDLNAKLVGLPVDKRRALLDLISSWLDEDATWTETEALRLHGKLTHLSTVAPLIKPFLRDASRFARSFEYHYARVLHAPASLRSSLAWVKDIVNDAPPRIPIVRDAAIEVGWYGDASTSGGIGILVGDFYALWSWGSAGLREARRRVEEDIGWAETVAVELGLVLLLELVDAGHLSLENTTNVLMHTDNASVYWVTRTGKARNEATRDSLKRIYRSLSTRQLYITSSWVASELNVTDELSRLDEYGFLRRIGRPVIRWQPALPSALQGYLC